jgi:hypothetical protein
MGLNSAAVGITLKQKITKANDYDNPVAEVDMAVSQQFLPGTVSGKVDLAFGPDRRTLAGGASESLDLIGGGLLDNLGNALAFVKVRALVIQNLSATKILTIGNDANPLVFLGAGAQTVVLDPNGMLALVNPGTGWPVTPDTGDKLKIANNAGDPADYLVWILGTSA